MSGSSRHSHIARKMNVFIRSSVVSIASSDGRFDATSVSLAMTVNF